MIAVDDATAATLVRRRFSTDTETLVKYLGSMRRWLAAEEGIGDDLYNVLEQIVGERAQPAPDSLRRPKLDDVLVRLRLPLPRRCRRGSAPPMDPAEAARITDHFRSATTELKQLAPHRTAVCPIREIARLIALADERPPPDQAVAHLRRYAFAILDVLDLMGDDA
ncbi:hypothetical protein DTL70_12400 [Streptomyces diacarni]|uniref:Uncharacterized protein n=1 Tax=Streptomyces diacarni TaxID=2800381 RepID=A0A367F2A1_9ACTN|nr:hypothetical protein [Streptomyces diacarni]RCG24079.1 hypothetical protein DTL70_12400 [Streptomyces diacarni]